MVGGGKEIGKVWKFRMWKLIDSIWIFVIFLVVENEMKWKIMKEFPQLCSFVFLCIEDN